MESYEVHMRQDFESTLRQIRNGHQREKLLFRGQTIDRPLIPSIRRGEGDSPSPGCIPALTIGWTRYARNLLWRFKTTEPTFEEVEAVAQHYGYRSFLVDVTWDPHVALWFALHAFNSQRTPLHVDKWLRSSVFQWAQYASCPSGYLYCIAVPEEQTEGTLVDLTTLMPTGAARIYAQKAATLILDGPKSAEDFVVAKLRVIDDGWYRDSDLNVAFGELFPVPSRDALYRDLCTVPYFMESGKRPVLANPLLGLFPLYAKSIYELVKEYVPLARILTGDRPALEWNVASARAELEDRSILADYATRIVMSAFMIEKLAEDVTIDDMLDVDVWPSRNLLLELEPEIPLKNPSKGCSHQVLRGYWIIAGARSLLTAEMVDTFEEVTLDHRCTYSLPRLGLMQKKCSCPEHIYDLTLFRQASQLLKDKTLILHRDKLGYLLLTEAGTRD